MQNKDVREPGVLASKAHQQISWQGTVYEVGEPQLPPGKQVSARTSGQAHSSGATGAYDKPEEISHKLQPVKTKHKDTPPSSPTPSTTAPTRRG